MLYSLRGKGASLMVKTRSKLIERRRFIRLETSVDITYVVLENGNIYNTSTKNISADGLRFQTHDKDISQSSEVELKLNIPGIINPIHAKAKVIWKRKLSLEDMAPYDVGMELMAVEEDNKNTFLKFLCDLIYNLAEEPKHADRSA